MKRTKEKIMIIAIAVGILFFAGDKVSAAEEYHTEKYRTEESQAEKGQRAESQSGKGQTEESQTEKSRTEESRIKESLPDEYLTAENVKYDASGQETADEESANYERFKNLENTSVEMDFLRNENLQQKTKILLYVVLAVIVLLFVKIKRMIYKKEKEKEDRR